MKKRALSAAAALGLLLLGAATLPQNQQPPGFRDVLRGRVGQECETLSRDGVWTLEFPLLAQGEEPGREAEQLQADTDLRLERLQVQLNNAQTVDERLKIERDAAMAQRFAQLLVDQNRAVEARNLVILAAVGQDFVQLRYQDGTERFIPMARVEVVVTPGK